MQFLFSPFWGTLSDKIGRRPIILFSIFISAIGHFLFAWATVLPLLFAARMLAGFGNANIGTAQAIIADVTTAENRSKGMALIGVAFGLGFLFGPALGGFLVQYSPQMPFIVGILSLLNFLFVFLCWKKPNQRILSPKKENYLIPISSKKQNSLLTSKKSSLSAYYTTAFAPMMLFTIY